MYHTSTLFIPLPSWVQAPVHFPASVPLRQAHSQAAHFVPKRNLQKESEPNLTKQQYDVKKAKISYHREAIWYT